MKIKFPSLNQFLMIGLAYLGWKLIDDRLGLSDKAKSLLPF